jgi:adenine deaminase
MATSKQISAAQGKIKADLVLKNAVLLNVFTDELLQQDIAICQGMIVGVGSDYEGTKEIDLTGKFIVPGFIDAHLHIESSMILPEELANIVCRYGTTTLIADPHEIANVAGIDGIRFMLSRSQNTCCNIFYLLPSCVPATDLDTSGARLTANDLLPFRHESGILGLGEMMNYAGVNQMVPEIMEKLSAFKDQIIDGHAPLLSGKELQSYIVSGIQTEHECSDSQEVLEKMRGGLAILAREGSAARNLDTVIQAALNVHPDWSRIAFCTDDKHLDDIKQNGHISYHIKRSMELGVDPIQAYKMASYYPAQIYGLKHLGAIAPGYQADLVVLDSLQNVLVHSVYHNGTLQFENGKTQSAARLPIPESILHSVLLPSVSGSDLALPVSNQKNPVIELIPHQINTNLLWEVLPSENGLFCSAKTYRKAAVLERHGKNGNIGVGVVKGFEIHGAIASTVSHDSHNLIVLGDNDADMITAIRELQRVSGGYTIVQDGNVLETIPLPVAGLMSDQSADFVREKTARFHAVAKSVGIAEEFDPFQTLSFLSLPVIPYARLTDRGVLDSLSFTYKPIQ